MRCLFTRLFIALLLFVALSSRHTHVHAQTPADAGGDGANDVDNANSNEAVPAPADPVNENEVADDDGNEEVPNPPSEPEVQPIPESGDVPSTVQQGGAVEGPAVPVDESNVNADDNANNAVDTTQDENGVVDDGNFFQEVTPEEEMLEEQEIEAELFGDENVGDEVDENGDLINNEQDIPNPFEENFDANIDDEFFDDNQDGDEVVEEVVDVVPDNEEDLSFAEIEQNIEKIVFAYHMPPGITEDMALANLPVMLLELLPVDDVEIVIKIVDEYYLGVFEVLAGEADFTETSAEAIISNHDELETVVVETYANGKHYHEILALTHEDDNIQSFGQLEGKSACFSKFNDNAAMKLPIGYYLRTNQMPAGPNLEATIASFFSNGSCAVPTLCETCKDSQTNGECTEADLYAGYLGAMECLMERAGNVAFIRDEDIDDPDNIEKPFVKLPMEDVRQPSHSVVIKRPGANIVAGEIRRQANLTRTELIRNQLREAFLSITSENPINQYLHSNHGYTTMSMDSQLEGFEENIACIPGLNVGLQCETVADTAPPAPTTGTNATEGNTTTTGTESANGTANGPPFETSFGNTTVRISVAIEISQEKKDELFELFTTGLLLKLEFITTQDTIEAVMMVANGTADLAIAEAYASMVAVGMELDAIAVQRIEGGNHFHTHQAWTKREEHSAGLRDFLYSRACFPRFGLDSAMTTAIGYQVRHGLIDDDAENLEVTIRRAYLETCAEPVICSACQDYDYLNNNTCDTTNEFAGYAGAIRCITDNESGHGGRVAFVRDDTVAIVCGQPNPPLWCLAPEEYEMIADFGEFPSNTIIYDPLRMDAALEKRLRFAFDVAKGDNDTTLLDHHEAYDSIFGLSLAEHLDEFSKNVACVPGIKDLLGYPNITLQPCVKENYRSGTVDDPIRFAYVGNEYNIDEIKEDFEDAIAGFEFEVVRAEDATHALRMVLNHEADFATVDPALAMKGEPFGITPIAYETYRDNVTTFYNAEAWVRKDSGITNFTGSQFLSSCHGSATSSVGMYFPVGYGIRKGYLNATSGQSITDVARAYWSKGQCAQPVLCDEVLCQSNQRDEDGELLCPIQANLPKVDSEDASALQCLYYGGDIAFIREGALSVACDDVVPGQSQALICRDRENYHKIMDLGKVPTDIVITHSQSFESDKREQFQNTFVNAYGKTVAGMRLRKYFGDHATYMVSTTAYDLNRHLRDYQKNVACLPDMAEVLSLGVLSEKKCNIDPGRDGIIENIRLAYVADRNFRDTTNLTILMNEMTGLNYEVIWAKSDHEAMDLVKSNKADVAYIDVPAVVYGMATDDKVKIMVAAQAPVSEEPYYKAQAWVLKDSSIQNIADTKGTKACHPAMRSSTGMYMWLQYAIDNDLIQVPTLSEDYVTDSGLEHLTTAIKSWFTESCAEPQLCGACSDANVDGLCDAMDDYAGLAGALKCLTMGGGDVAFLPDHAWEQVCENPLPENEDWCLSKDSYRLIHTFGEVPTRMFVTIDGRLDHHSHSIIDGLLLELEPREINIHNRLNVYFDNGRADGYKRSEQNEFRMKEYMRLLACVPDIYYLMGLPDTVVLPECEIVLPPTVGIQGPPGQVNPPTAPSRTPNAPILNIDLGDDTDKDTTVGQETGANSASNDLSTSSNTADGDDDSIETLAIVAIALAVFFLVSAPFIAYGMARTLYRRWLRKDGLDGNLGPRGSNASSFEPNSFESTTSTTHTATAVDVQRRPSDMPSVGTTTRLV